MDVKGSLGQVRTWLWLALGGSMLTVFKYTLENSAPPKWVSKLFGVSGAAFDTFAAKAVPLWSVLVVGLLVILIAVSSILILILSVRLYRTNRQITSLSSTSQEIRLSRDKLEQIDNERAPQRTVLSKDLASAHKALDEAKEERDSARKKLDRITSDAKKLVFTLEGLASAGAFKNPSGSSLLPKFAKLFSNSEIVLKTKAEILKAVMLLTKTELSAAKATQIDDLIGLGNEHIERYANPLVSDGYLTLSRVGLQATYKLTPKANTYFKCVGNKIPSELQFN